MKDIVNDKEQLKNAIYRSAKGMYTCFPMILSVILLVSLSNILIPKEIYTSFFRGNLVSDTIVGSLAGSILAGNPITSYILGGEMLNQGVSLVAVTAFLLAWVTVGIIQFPAEAMLLGKKFAITRNIVSFISAIVIAIVAVSILRVL